MAVLHLGLLLALLTSYIFFISTYFQYMEPINDVSSTKGSLISDVKELGICYKVVAI